MANRTLDIISNQIAYQRVFGRGDGHAQLRSVADVPRRWRIWQSEPVNTGAWLDDLAAGEWVEIVLSDSEITECWDMSGRHMPGYLSEASAW